jgi:Rrf2 family protein
MRLSTKSRYGVRILAQIAIESRNGNKTPSGKIIAAKQNITEGYLEQIMIPFKHAGFVGTVRGCNGGYKLLKSEERISVLDIIELFEGRVRLASCHKQCARDGNVKNCPTFEVWSRLEKLFREEAASITIREIVDNHLA